MATAGNDFAAHSIGHQHIEDVIALPVLIDVTLTGKAAKTWLASAGLVLQAAKSFLKVGHAN
ncbi:hypothetical protein M6G63_12640 [Pseudomonas sp. BYT-5]|uniref:hypothetical protein n=1 Tax=unclassified Pseudomonas TaxID=196821 RepID=UPI0005BA2002|nr:MULTISPECIES: hypothetical protein [unclassified Pseudomonas]URD40355.1 hypothetical protein M6G63_12640 [Pseudomonas sp. BYT-5]URL00376.1 hypothetical protein J5X93_12605 [Pseudomonas sp. BYT-1]